LVYVTQAIINVEFFSQTPGKYLGLVHVKTMQETLIVPVDIHAIKGGLFRDPEEIDFGTLTDPKQMQSVAIRLLNSGLRSVAVMDVHPATLEPALQLLFKRGTVLLPGVETYVATVSWTGATQVMTLLNLNMVMVATVGLDG
jgi:hypothetical protein